MGACLPHDTTTCVPAAKETDYVQWSKHVPALWRVNRTTAVELRIRETQRFMNRVRVSTSEAAAQALIFLNNWCFKDDGSGRPEKDGEADHVGDAFSAGVIGFERW